MRLCNRSSCRARPGGLRRASDRFGLRSRKQALSTNGCCGRNAIATVLTSRRCPSGPSGNTLSATACRNASRRATERRWAFENRSNALTLRLSAAAESESVIPKCSMSITEDGSMADVGDSHATIARHFLKWTPAHKRSGQPTNLTTFLVFLNGTNGDAISGTES